MNPWKIIVLTLCSLLFAADTTKIYWFGHSLLSSPPVGRAVEFAVWSKQQNKPVYQKMVNSGSNYSYEIVQSWHETYNKDSIALGPTRNGLTHWDYVIYDKLYKPYIAMDSFLYYHKRYIDTIKSTGAIPIIYEEWFYDVHDTIIKICRENGLYFTPIYEANLWCEANYPDIHYRVDWAHAAPPLGYLAGSCCWSTLYGVPTFGYDKVYKDLLPEEAHLMQQVAWNFCTMQPNRAYQPWAGKTIRFVKSIGFTENPDTLEQYRTRQFQIRTVFDNDSMDAASKWAIFKSLTPDIVSVSHSGLVTGRKLGLGRVVAMREWKVDTLSLTVKATTLTLDSIRILPRSFSTYLSNGFQFTCMGYFRDGTAPTTLDITPSVRWFSGDTTVFTVREGYLQRVTAQGGRMFAAVEMGGKVDTARFTLVPELRFLSRINFQARALTYNPNWNPDSGVVYSDSRGYGWLNTAPQYFTKKVDDQGINFYDSNFLRTTYIVPMSKTSPSTAIWADYKINAPDGDYIVKAVMGSYYAYNMPCSLIYAGDSIVDTVGAFMPTNIKKQMVMKDTVRVFGESGIKFRVFGPIAYLVVCTDEGVDIDSISLDSDEFIKAEVEAGALRLPEKDGLSVFPNPFQPTTGIYLNLATVSPVTVKIYDVAGRMVRTLARNIRKVGLSRIDWDGRDQHGQPLGSGLYMVKMEGAGTVRTVRALLAR